jgi:serine carboxypeptidase-like clade 2
VVLLLALYNRVMGFHEMGRCWFGAVFIVVISFWLLVSDDVDGYPVEDLVLNLLGQPKVGFK